MRKYIVILASAVTLAAWTAFGYHEGLKKVPHPLSVDTAVTSLAGKDLYCFGIFGGVEPCVVAAHDPNSNKVLLVPKSMTDSEPATPEPDQAPPKAQ
jgi:hypothetical protein